MTYKEDAEETRRNFVKRAVDAVLFLDEFSDSEEYKEHLGNLKCLLLATEKCLYLERNTR